MPLSDITNTFTGNPLDRASDRRVDPDWIAARFAEPGTLALPLWNGQPMVEDGGGRARLAYVGAHLARELASDDEHRLFLGLRDDGAPVFAFDLESPTDPSVSSLQGLGRFDGLRGLAARLPAPEVGVAATAKAVFEWRRRHGFCSKCGQRSEVADAGWKRRCPACAAEHFPRTDPVAIMLPVRGEECLLGRQAAWPAGMYSALAGFMEPGESIEEACARELREEAALNTLSVRYHSSQPWPFPSNLMIGLIAEVDDGEASADQAELETVRWFEREEATALLQGELDGLSAPPPLAIAHQLIKSWVAG